MSVHMSAKAGEIADRVLLPGDPLRAKYIAENFLEGAVCYTQVRGMLGYTGTYKGQRVSVQGTGMGVPSISIYAHELIKDYGVKRLIRVGTCGAYQESLQLRDIILAMSAATDSAVNQYRFGTITYAPTASFPLLLAAYQAATQLGKTVQVGSVFTTDTFYTEDESMTQKLIDYGVLAVEMESAALYTLAAKFGVESLSVLTVSDHLITHAQTTSDEREKSFGDMVEIALEASIAP